MKRKRMKIWILPFFNADNLKKCNRCNEWKDKDMSFNKHKREKDGYSYICKDCRSIERKEKYVSKKKYDQFYTTENIKKYIRRFGYIPLFDEYITSNTKYLLKCPYGHEFEMMFGNFKKGQRCPVCYEKVRGKCKLLSYDYIKSYIELNGYQLISKKYKNSNSKLKIQCDKGHVYRTKWNYFQQGHRCPVCAYNSKSSKAEKEIQEYVASIYSGTIVNNDRNTIINENTGCFLELDVYLPELKKAIEYNGVYWHCDIYQQEKDKIKLIQCKEKCIDLLIIQDNDWKINKSICLQTIKKFIGG